MAVRTYTRKKDGATVYLALYRGPRGQQIPERFRVVSGKAG